MKPSPVAPPWARSSSCPEPSSTRVLRVTRHRRHSPCPAPTEHPHSHRLRLTTQPAGHTTTSVRDHPCRPEPYAARTSSASGARDLLGSSLVDRCDVGELRAPMRVSKARRRAELSATTMSPGSMPWDMEPKHRSHAALSGRKRESRRQGRATSHGAPDHSLQRAAPSSGPSFVVSRPHRVVMLPLRAKRTNSP